MASPTSLAILTSSNLQKHTIQAHETPRTKVIRYFNQVEDPTILTNREQSPILSPKHPWDLHNTFTSSTLHLSKLM
jgi:hypothetical protein